MNLGKLGVIVAARTASTRLPGKALLPFYAGMPMIQFLLRRLRPSAHAEIVLATTVLSSDDKLAALAEADGFSVFRGADADVVGRYVAAAKRFGFDTVVRVTGDCPFVDAEVVDWCIAQACTFDHFDVATTKGRFPVGIDVEIYAAQRMAMLDSADVLTPKQREHLTLYFYDNDKECAVRSIEPRNEWRIAGRHFTVDTQQDFDSARAFAAHFPAPDFSVQSLCTSLAA